MAQRVKGTCKNCKEDFYGLIRHGVNPMYCSKKCQTIGRWTPAMRELQRNRLLGKPGLKRGKTASLVTLKRQSLSQLRRFSSKENHPRWISDRTKIAKRQERNDTAYKEWRKSVRDRDKWKCRMSNNDCAGRLESHHILPWSLFENLRYDINNGITLCHFHHPRKRVEESRLAPFLMSLLISET
jgi:hypothetical protein